jgi:hypothetical protein
MYAVMGGANRSMSNDEDGMAGFHEIFTPELYVSLFLVRADLTDVR